ncbi:MAG: Fe-S cluster assembly protein SufD [Acidobacteria bacterium]|nr:MAG: Fe-S cluster assembly protein SufD [Acidobacteriota bacterium]
MQAVAERVSLLADYDDFAATVADQPSPIADLRREGRERFAALGFPTTRQEAWRKTNVRRIAQGSFRRAPGELHGLSRARLEPFFLPDCAELVFVNGRLAPELSQPRQLPPGVIATSLAEAIAEHPDLVAEHLGRYAPIDQHPFAALNTAFIADGAFVYVPRGTVVETPIHFLFVGTAGEEATVSYPRNLLLAAESSQVTVIESYAGFGGDRYFTCPVTEIVCGANAVVDHYKMQEESIDAFHVAMQQSHQRRSSNLFSHSISHGGALVRNDIRAMLAEEGIDCTLNGLYLARGTQHVDHHMWVDHKAPHCNSYELYKGVLEGSSRAVFNGTIYVHPGAQKTDAKQSNRNLLLSRDALVSSNPQLEIFADDVRCTHGSTTGHLEEEAIFYLRTRGIGEEAAKSLLTFAFAAEVLQEIRLESIKKGLEEFLFTRLPKGDVVRQAV